MNYLETLDDIKSHVENLFRVAGEKGLHYHNIQHTEHVVAQAAALANYYHLGDKDFFTVAAACWFHDIGYLQRREDHEVLGAAAAEDYLRRVSLDKDHVEEIKQCILATRMPQRPEGLLQEIVCDADLYHLGTPRFNEINKEMRRELNQHCGISIGKQHWREESVRFLKAHHFHTSFGKEKLEGTKQANLEALLKKVNRDQAMTKEALDPTFQKHESPLEKGNAKAKSERPEKGIETMFRITSSNHQRLSDMADNKAHIMISTNSIILSVILSILLRKLEDNPHLILPTIILLVICVVTMVFSILATRPAIPPGTFTRDDVRSQKVNLLFFGNFYRMLLSDYQEGMHQLMENKDFLYDSLIKDLHGQGVVLGRKYRLLRMAYNVFMYGIIASVVAFIVAMVYIAL